MKSLYLILILAISATTGCSHSSSVSRQERAYAKYVKSRASRQESAYAKYVKKSKIEREKRQAAFRKKKAKIPEPGAETSEPQEMMQTSTSEGPQAVPSEFSSQ
jgi:hypothetical protein